MNAAIVTSWQTLPADGPPLTPAQAGALHQVPASTALKWITVGVTVGGRRVRLAGYKAGGCWRIPPAALNDFIAACNPDPVPVQLPSPSATRRRYAADKKQALAMIDAG